MLAGAERVVVRLVRSAAGLGLDIGVHCEIVSVAEGSQAAGKGVEPGDVIVGVNGVEIGTHEASRDALVDAIGSIGMYCMYSCVFATSEHKMCV